METTFKRTEKHRFGGCMVDLIRNWQQPVSYKVEIIASAVDDDSEIEKANQQRVSWNHNCYVNTNPIMWKRMSGIASACFAGIRSEQRGARVQPGNEEIRLASTTTLIRHVFPISKPWVYEHEISKTCRLMRPYSLQASSSSNPSLTLSCTYPGAWSQYEDCDSTASHYFNTSF